MVRLDAGVLQRRHLRERRKASPVRSGVPITVARDELLLRVVPDLVGNCDGAGRESLVRLGRRFVADAHGSLSR